MDAEKYLKRITFFEKMKKNIKISELEAKH